MSDNEKKALIALHEAGDQRDMMIDYAQRQKYQVDVATKKPDYFNELEINTYDVVLADINLQFPAEAHFS